MEGSEVKESGPLLSLRREDFITLYFRNSFIFFFSILERKMLQFWSLH